MSDQLTEQLNQLAVATVLMLFVQILPKIVVTRSINISRVAMILLINALMRYEIMCKV